MRVHRVLGSRVCMLPTDPLSISPPSTLISAVRGLKSLNTWFRSDRRWAKLAHRSRGTAATAETLSEGVEVLLKCMLVKVVSLKCGCQVSGISGYVRPMFPWMLGVKPFMEVRWPLKAPVHSPTLLCASASGAPRCPVALVLSLSWWSLYIIIHLSDISLLV